MTTLDLSLKLDNDGTEVPFPAVTDATSEAGISVPVTANLRVAGVDVDGGNPLPVAGVFADENGVPYSDLNPLPVDVGANITIDTLTVSFDSAISTLNQPPATLTAGQVWTGTWEDVSDYSAVSVVYLVDAMSAVNGAQAQFSEDGVTPIFSEVATVPPGIAGWSVFAPRARYFRIVYTNGAAPAGVRAQITYHFNPPAVARTALGAQVTDLSIAQITKAAVVGHDVSGVWTPLAVDPTTGAALVDTGLTLQTDALTDAELRASAVPVSGTVTAVDAAEDAALTAYPFTVTAAGTVTLVPAPGAGNGRLRLRRISPTYAIRSPSSEPILSLQVGTLEVQRGNALTGRFDVTAAAATDAITLTVDVLDAGGKIAGTVYAETVA